MLLKQSLFASVALAMFVSVAIAQPAQSPPDFQSAWLAMGGEFKELGGTPTPHIPLAGVSVPTALFAFAFAMVLGVLFNTEEVAWRGFILPRLQARRTRVASLSSGLCDDQYCPSERD